LHKDNEIMGRVQHLIEENRFFHGDPAGRDSSEKISFLKDRQDFPVSQVDKKQRGWSVEI
jgi:hypothetical protein